MAILGGFMSHSFVSFMRLVNNAVGAFKSLSSFFSMPLSTYLTTLRGGVFGSGLSIALSSVISRIPWFQSVSLYDVLFTSATVQVILAIGIIRWFLDILP